MNHDWALLNMGVTTLLKVLFTAFATVSLATRLKQYRYGHLSRTQKTYLWVTAYSVSLGWLWIMGMVLVITGRWTSITPAQAYMLIFGGITPVIAAGTTLGLLTSTPQKGG